VPELVVHIGAGKTGSTSIQFSLRNAGAALTRQGIQYLGLMLETLPAARGHDWCVQGQPQKFTQATDPERTDEEVYQVLRRALKRMDARGITRAIWSNEAFLVQSRRILPILQRLAADGVVIRPICYVRRHDKRARSAYVEFGLKSKRYPGDLRPFRDWADTYTIGYAKALAPWQAAFPDTLELYNFDAVDDVAAHFCEVVGARDITPVRANESPSTALLAAWAVYNGSQKGPTWANDFRRLARPLKLHDAGIGPVPPLSALMPTPDDITAVQHRFQGDLDAVNALLEAQGRPPMTFGPVAQSDSEVPAWEMDQMLLQMVFALQEQVLRLQARVNALSGDGDGGGGDDTSAG
jgi:hypothetical protein